MESGLDRLLQQGPELAGLARGAAVGLLVHSASVDRNAVPLLRELPRRTGLVPLRLFAPEHGLGGEAQDMEHVADGEERSTGLPVVSLYGATAASLAPTAESLGGLDAVVCDLQDVGSRYYTYVATLFHVMEAAGRAGVPVVVLDRPNPLGGIEIEGPVLDPAWASFVGRFPLPVRHGLTPGELALLVRDEYGVSCELRVVPLSGWRRSMHFEDTRLPWVPPSPNMPTVDTAFVYPGGCLIEGTNLSEGRGTTRPFEWVGAPWLDGEQLADDLRDADLPGAWFRPSTFRPVFHKHRGRACAGVQVIVHDRERFRPFATYLELIAAARRQDPRQFDWRREPYEFETKRLAIDLLLGRGDLRQRLEAGASAAELAASWAADLAAFAALRREYLLY